MESGDDFTIKRPSIIIQLSENDRGEINETENDSSKENNKTAAKEANAKNVKTVSRTTLDVIETIATRTGK